MNEDDVKRLQGGRAMDAEDLAGVPARSMSNEEIISRAIGERRAYMKRHDGRDPTYLVVDADTYLSLREYFRRTAGMFHPGHRDVDFVPPPRLERLAGMKLIVAPAPGIFAAVGEPWDEALYFPEAGTP